MGDLSCSRGSTGGTSMCEWCVYMSDVTGSLKYEVRRR